MFEWEDLPVILDFTFSTLRDVQNEAWILREELGYAQRKFRLGQLPGERRGGLLRFARIALESVHRLYSFSLEEVSFFNRTIPLIPAPEILLTTQELLLELFLV